MQYKRGLLFVILYNYCYLFLFTFNDCFKFAIKQKKTIVDRCVSLSRFLNLHLCTDRTEAYCNVTFLSAFTSNHQ